MLVGGSQSVNLLERESAYIKRALVELLRKS